MTTSNTVTIADNGVVFTCSADNNTTTHAYPRSTDPASGSALSITAVTGTTITVNVGVANVTIDYITIPSSAEFAWGGNAFTMELYVNPAASSLSGTHTLVDMRASAANEVASRLYLEAGQIRYNVNNSDLVTSGATTLNNNTWYHIAVQRSSTTTKIYLDGTEVGTGTDSTTYVAKPVRIGAD